MHELPSLPDRVSLNPEPITRPRLADPMPPLHDYGGAGLRDGFPSGRETNQRLSLLSLDRVQRPVQGQNRTGRFAPHADTTPSLSSSLKHPVQTTSAVPAT